MAQSKNVTGWVGWIYFAGCLMMLVGIFQTIAGLVALFRDDVYLVAADKLLVFDYTEWGWIHLIIGLILFLSSLSVFTGGTWGRLLGSFLAGLSAIANFAFLTAYPLWSSLVIIVDVLIIYALIAHGREMRA
jgi:hypothetical protein